MDEDIQLIQNWLKETESDCSNKRPDEDIIEAIYSLIDDWKSNKEVRTSYINIISRLYLDPVSVRSSTNYAFVFLDSIGTKMPNPKYSRFNSFPVSCTPI